mgnify:CR=1 FL=1
MRRVIASGGEVTYVDHGTPWSIVAPNMRVELFRRPARNDYGGTAAFDGATIRIQSYEPFGAKMDSRLSMVAPNLHFDRIDLVTDGAVSILEGDLQMNNWPEQIYRIKSRIDIATQKEIFFEGQNFTADGEATFDGEDLFTMGSDELRRLRRRAQIVFQDPFASLNPRMTVGDALREVLRVHDLARGEAADRRIAELLETVGLLPEHRHRYPHEFSGGQRQRIGIARALSVEPDFIVCDEPVSALDVSVQAQVLNLLQDLQERLGVAYLFIAHDLSVVEHVSDQIAVMYLGRIVELGDRDQVTTAPGHPYTRALLSAVPVPDPPSERRRQRIVLTGDVPDPARPPSGCRFRTRCPEAFDACPTIDPVLQPLADGAAGPTDADAADDADIADGAPHEAACLLHGRAGAVVEPT